LTYLADVEQVAACVAAVVAAVVGAVTVTYEASPSWTDEIERCRR